QIELKRDAVPQVALNKLFKHTPLQSTFGVNTVALVNGVPRTLSLLELLTQYLDFQREIVTRRSKHELRQKEKRAHILQAYLLALKGIYGRHDDRRTEIVAAEEELELEDLIAEEDMVIAITRSNYIKRLPVTAYREQRRGGIGVMGMDLKEDDYIEHLFVASTHDYILFFTSLWKFCRRKVDELACLWPSSGHNYGPTISRKGQAARCHESQVRSMGRSTEGVKGMTLRKGDEVIEITIATNDADLLVVTANGYGKRTRIDEYR